MKAAQIQNIHLIGQAFGGHGGKDGWITDKLAGGITRCGGGKQNNRRVGKIHEDRAAGIPARGR